MLCCQCCAVLSAMLCCPSSNQDHASHLAAHQEVPQLRYQQKGQPLLPPSPNLSSLAQVGRQPISHFFVETVVPLAWVPVPWGKQRQEKLKEKMVERDRGRER
eukprot:Sspe_Gene.112187::Locus_95109_Transcript_1_1_Confidence_1.000_Length_749::g.112187::m.112187